MAYNLVEKFADRLRMQRYAENSISSYTTQLVYFLKISEKYKAEEITDARLEKFTH